MMIKVERCRRYRARSSREVPMQNSRIREVGDLAVRREAWND